MITHERNNSHPVTAGYENEDVIDYSRMSSFPTSLYRIYIALGSNIY